MQQYLQNKKGLVQSVFDRVYSKYDLMNDFMSLCFQRAMQSITLADKNMTRKALHTS